MAKRIKDPVHGYVAVEDEFVQNIVDCEYFQRLRFVRQLTGTYMVYPSANHTRFEHSLGVYHLAGKAFDNLMEDDGFEDVEDIEELRNTVLSAALLHDIGHPPLSHIGEGLLDRDILREKLRDLGLEEKLQNATPTGTHLLSDEGKHELLSCVLILEKFEEGLEEIGVDPYEVCGFVFGISIEGENNNIWQRKVAAELISSSMDVDRLDYIARDDQMTGAGLAKVDIQRMIRSYAEYEGSLVFSDKALSAIGNYLDGRLSMYKWINQHHKVIFADALLKEAVEELEDVRDDEIISMDTLLDKCVGDAFLMEQLRMFSEENQNSRVAHLYKKFKSRDFLDSCWKHRLGYDQTLDNEVVNQLDKVMSRGRIEEVEEQLIDHLGIDGDELWVRKSEVPEYTTSDLRNIHIRYGNDKYSLDALDVYKIDPIYTNTPFIYTSSGRTDEVIEGIASIM